MKTFLLGATLLAGFGAANTVHAAPVALTQAAASRTVAFDVVLPLRNADQLDAFVADLHNPASPNFHKWLTPAQFGLRFGPETASIQRTTRALRALGFNVRVQTRSLRVTGTADQVQSAFGTRLMVARTADGMAHVQQEAALKMPAAIAAEGASVFSFAPTMAHVYSQSTRKVNPDNRYRAAGTYWFTDLKQAYRYPDLNATVTASDGKTKPLDGSGVTIAALMSSDVYDADIAAVFDHELWTTITGKRDPVLAGRVYVNGGSGPVNPNTGVFDEASLDTQMEITGAPGANVVLYDIPDLSDGSVFAGYVDVVENNSVDLVSSSFGQCELDYKASRYGSNAMRIVTAQHEIFLQGNAQGITFLASSGDSAGKQCPNITYYPGFMNGVFQVGVSAPANDTAVTAVGGTNLVTTYTPGSLKSAYVNENGWSDPELNYDPYGIGVTAGGGVWGAGGGYSEIFAQPAYQKVLDTQTTTQRAMPDIGMQVGGCPGGISKLQYVPALGRTFCDGQKKSYDGNGNYERSAVVVAIATQQGGGFYGFIGTSVSSPELASAVALLIEQKGRMGNLNHYIYNLAAQQAMGGTTAYHTNIPGYNGFRDTNLNPTFSLTAGVGTPYVRAFVGLPDVAPAGNPQTKSNP